MKLGVRVGSISLYSIQLRWLGNVRAPSSKVHVTPPEHEEVEQFDPPETERAASPFLERPRVRRSIAALLSLTFLITSASLVYYIKLAHEIDQRLPDGPFSGTVDIFAAPRTI